MFRATIEELGLYGYSVWQTLKNMKYIFADRKRVIYQMEHAGVNSIPLVVIVGLFAGGIIAWQAAYQFKGLVSFSLMGGSTAKAIIMELGPVLTSIVIAGRIGASMTAEIGSMKITEQIDALRTMAIDPVRYLTMPRFVALCVMLPVLVLFSNIIAVLGSYLVCVVFLDLSFQTFFESVRDMLVLKDLFGGLIKSIGFGAIVSTISCYLGFKTEGGAEGVGQSTIQSFVYSSIFILIFDFSLWIILY